MGDTVTLGILVVGKVHKPSTYWFHTNAARTGCGDDTHVPVGSSDSLISNSQV